LIAEEVAEVDPRLVHWGYLEQDWETVQIDENDNSLTKRRLREDARLVPDGVAYERLSVLLLSLVKRQHARIELIERRLAALSQEMLAGPNSAEGGALPRAS
jgi:hypothetical protein